MITKEQRQESLTRQLDLIPLECLSRSITVIGAGAIGGWTILSLAKMGFENITVYDFDTVDTVNMSSQLYRFKDIGKPKVTALQEIVEEFTNIKIMTVNDKYTTKLLSTDIVISAVDSMSVRKQIWDTNKSSGLIKKLIDPRMGSETALLYVMNPNDDKDIQSYEKTLYTDENAVAEPCTRKSTQYCALVLSGLICSEIKSIVNGHTYNRITQFDIPKGGYLSWKNQ